MHLDDELALLSYVFQAAGERFHVIEHSFGGAIALKAALTNRDRLISLVLYEPVLFSVLVANAPQSPEAREIIAVRDDTIRLVDEGDLTASAQRFIDYWGALHYISEHLQAQVRPGQRHHADHRPARPERNRRRTTRYAARERECWASPETSRP
jgi:pimeloyl-ACP methyl ester carboxylesterase